MSEWIEQLQTGVCEFSGKQSYASEKDAMLALDWINLHRTAVELIGTRYRKKTKRETRAYECHVCHSWHLTSEPDKGKIKLTAVELLLQNPDAYKAMVKWIPYESTGRNHSRNIIHRIIRRMDSYDMASLLSNEWLWACVRNLYRLNARKHEYDAFIDDIRTGMQSNDSMMMANPQSIDDYNLIRRITGGNADDMNALFTIPCPIAILSAWQVNSERIMNRVNNDDNANTDEANDENDTYNDTIGEHDDGDSDSDSYGDDDSVNANDSNDEQDDEQ